MTFAADQLRAALVERFDRLRDESPPRDEQISTIDLPITIGGSPVLVGRDFTGSHLLVPLAAEQHRTFKDDRRSAGVHLVLRPLERDGVLRWYADLVCLQTRLFSVFASLLADAVVRLDAMDDDGSPDRPLRRCLADWRALLASGERLFTTRQLAGLFGELRLLVQMLERDAGATSAWIGPLGARHDFLAGLLAIEVKTSLTEDGLRVRVHGLDQLDAPLGGELALHHVRVAEASAGGPSVVDLIERAQGVATDDVLAGRLHALGYRPAHAEAYRRISFRVIGESWYRVAGAFPRLSAHHLPAGVTDAIGALEYELNLAAAPTDVVMSEAAVDIHIRNLLTSR